MIKTKILVVDDYKENILALEGLIATPEVEIFSAMNADQALELIDRNEFGLLLLDVQMPGTSGFELAKIIRSVQKYRSLPIIFVTAHQGDSSVIFEGYKSGAVDLLFKPLDGNIVRAKVQMFVEMARQKALLQSQVNELERLRIEADAANLAKSQFLANMSHEMRTPLAAVMGFAELITRSQSDNNETRELSAAVERNGSLLLRLIDDILDLSKIEAGRLELEKTEFDLAELLHDIDSTLTFRAREKGLVLNMQTSTPQTKYISDPTRIKQILLNIIGNAIKFTAAGRVDVSVHIEPPRHTKLENSKKDSLVIHVKDQGIGLNLAQSERLFRPFGQADPSTKRLFGGSGLGLVISRQIARAMQGDLKLIASEPGQGSTFEIVLEIERSEGAHVALQNRKLSPLKNSASDMKVDLKSKWILAIDDSPDNLTLISMFLKETGVRINFAKNGLEAIVEIQKNNFDLVLMDIQMPGMDGNEATVEIRKLGFKNPIIALTAHAIRSEQEKCLASGCDMVLTKPVSRNHLVDTVSKYLNLSKST